jgi:hypothetical protein
MPQGLDGAHQNAEGLALSEHPARHGLARVHGARPERQLPKQGNSKQHLCGAAPKNTKEEAKHAKTAIKSPRSCTAQAS